ncbi:MAG TPA: hypothetical protein VMD29_01340 [Terracidiphilus sp.]|nr:hypothetical protein [Terracidiphilus sp.]
MILFKSLRERGVEIPSDEELRDHPAEALRHGETARYFQTCQSPTADPPTPQAGKEPPPAQQKETVPAA